MRANSGMPIRHSQMLVLEILCTMPGPHTPMMLADLGYVSRVVSPDDGRSVIILPTKKGRKLYLEYLATNQRLLSDLSQKMGIKKFESLIKLISLANKYLAE